MNVHTGCGRSWWAFLKQFWLRWFSLLCTYWGQVYWHNARLVHTYKRKLFSRHKKNMDMSALTDHSEFWMLHSSGQSWLALVMPWLWKRASRHRNTSKWYSSTTPTKPKQKRGLLLFELMVYVQLFPHLDVSPTGLFTHERNTIISMISCTIKVDWTNLRTPPWYAPLRGGITKKDTLRSAELDRFSWHFRAQLSKHGICPEGSYDNAVNCASIYRPGDISECSNGEYSHAERTIVGNKEQTALVDNRGSHSQQNKPIGEKSPGPLWLGSTRETMECVKTAAIRLSYLEDERWKWILT